MRPIDVLLVEDCPGDILMVKQAMARERFPVCVRVAVDGKQAIDILSQRHRDPDVVILDLALPKVDGLTVLKQTCPHPPVIVFSSSNRPDEIRRAFELGAREFIAKPLDIDQYARVVSYIVRRWGAGEQDASPMPSTTESY